MLNLNYNYVIILLILKLIWSLLKKLKGYCPKSMKVE